MKFLLPMLELSSKIKSDVLMTYIGNVEFEGNDNWGRYIYIELDNLASKSNIEILRKHKWYIGEYDPTEVSIIFIFQPNEEIYRNVIAPFCEGKYSKIDKTYVNKYFSNQSSIGLKSMEWKICNKNSSIKRYWEDRIGVALSEEAEVWSRPKKEDEIYGYEN